MSNRWLIFLLLGPGVIALATAVIFIKLSELPIAMLAALRLLTAAGMLAPLMVWERRGTQGPAVGRLMWIATPAAVMLAAHFVTWFAGVKLTTAANATLIVNLSPVAMPFAVYFMVGEKINRREILGSLIAVVGVLVLGLGQAKIDRQGLLGDAICIGSMVLAVIYLVLARRVNRAVGGGIFSYLVPLYFVAGLVTLGYSGLSGEWFRLGEVPDWPREVGLVLLLAILPTVIGHSLLNYSMTRLRGQVVAVASLGQIFVAAALAVPVLGEWPTWAFYPACALIAAGAGVVIFKTKKPQAAAELRGFEVVGGSSGSASSPTGGASAGRVPSAASGSGTPGKSMVRGSTLR